MLVFMKRIHTPLSVLPVIFFAVCTLLPLATKASTTAVLLPQSDGFYKQLKPKSGTVHYTQVNESPAKSRGVSEKPTHSLLGHFGPVGPGGQRGLPVSAIRGLL
jgi:hypothetical protein